MERHRNFPDFWTAIVILGILLGLQIVIAAAIYDLGFRFEHGDPGVVGVINGLSFGLALSLLLRYRGLRITALLNPSSNSLFSMAVLLTVPILLVIAGEVFWASDLTAFMFLHVSIDEHEQEALLRMLSGGFVSVVTVCIIAPVVEEMLFRGIILRGFLANYRPGPAIVLSSLLFAAFHLTVTQLPVTLFLGLFFGWLYVKTRSLWPSIIGHFLHNSFAMLIWSTYASQGTGYRFVPAFNPPMILAAGIASTVIGIVLLHHFLRPTQVTRNDA